MYPLSKRALAGVLALSLLTLTACGNQTSAQTGQHQTKSTSQGGQQTLVIDDLSETRDLTTIDPLNKDITLPRSMVYDSLFVKDKDGKLEPSLAQSYQTKGNTLEIKLKHGIKFQNGDPLNAQSVKATIEKILHPDPNEESAFTSLLANIKQINVVNQWTVDIVTAHADYILPQYLTNISIVDAKQLAKGNQYQTDLNGTGPYMLADWKRGQEVVLKANPHYWGKKPQFKKVVIKYVPDESTRIADLLSGHASIASDLTPESIDRITSNANSHVVTSPGDRVTYMSYNFNGPLANEKVRQAIYYALDRKTMTADVYGKYATPATAPVAKGASGYVDAFPLSDYNVAKAKKLLAEAGVKAPLSISLHVGQTDLDVAEVIQSQLKQVGIQVHIDVLAQGELLDPKQLNKPEPIMFIFTGLDNPEEDAYRIYAPTFSSESFIKPFGYKPSAQVAQLVQQYLAAPNLTERTQVSKQILDITKQQAAVVWLLQPANIYGVSNDIEWHVDGATQIHIQQIQEK
jgi:peptide/nickel transport system substrate-binding protein